MILTAFHPHASDNGQPPGARMVRTAPLWPVALTLAAGTVAVITCAGLVAAHSGQFALREETDRVTVEWDGQLFCQYHVDVGGKPVIWPLIGPTGHNVLRGFPLADPAPGELRDHPHHRGLWLGHAQLNGINFWDESDKAGRVVHRSFQVLQGGANARIVAANDWLDSEGSRILSEVRTLTLGATPNQRWVDYDIAIHATDGPVNWANTKEALFALRLATGLTVDAGQEAVILNSAGDRNQLAWGKPASWVDSSGQIGDQACGVAILNHPASFRYPNRWHVRTYGLLAANPFGERFFRNQADYDASYELPAGQSLSLYFRILLHRGNAQSGHVSEAFTEYARCVKPSTGDGG